MISFRHHIVTLVAVFLALAVGVVLGGGPLSEVGRTGDQELQAAERRVDQAQETSEFEDAFALKSAPRVLAGILKDQPVAVLTMPGADAELVKRLATLVGQAGGSVAGTYAVQPALVDLDERSLVDTLGSQVAESLEATTVPAATTYPRIGFLIGRAVSVPGTALAAVDADASSILESLDGAGLLKASGKSAGRAPLVLVVQGAEPAADSGTANALGGILAGLRGNSTGVVVAGATGSGLLEALRADTAVTGKVATVDSVQTGAGSVAAVLALAAAKGGKIGAYGASGADGPAALG